jgi:putative DNA primase/helicase
VPAIPLFLTHDTKALLKELGHTDTEIAAMTPAEGWQALLGGSALQLSKLGWYVFPCVPGGKKPITAHGFKDATRDPATIRAWWDKTPLANIGVDCGRSKLAVVDLDVKNGADGPGTWQDLKIQHGIDDLGALEQITPSGGVHKIFKATTPIKNTAGQLGPGIDTRGNGGYIVVAPSRTDQGSYVWEASSHPADQQAGPWPAELVPLLSNGHKPAGDPWEQATEATDPDHITEGERNVRLTSMAGKMRRSGFSAAEMLPALLAYDLAHCDPPLQTDTPAGQVEAMPPAGSPKESILTRADASDEGNARCVVALYPNQFLFCEAFGWMAHRETHWGRELAESQLDRAIVTTLQKRRFAAIEKDREGIVKTTRATATNVRNAKYLVQSLIPASVSDFDSFPNLLNCKNGVLDLRTGNLVAHQPGQRFTYCLPIEYDPEADYSEWRALLLEWTGGDVQVVDFLQSAIGYTLTGHTSEECLFYLHGPTRSGKGTFSETLLAMLGKEPLATGVDFSTFTMDRSHDSQNFDLAGLKPCRLVMASESSKYSSLNVARVKSLTGGDEVRCAFKRKDHFALEQLPA